MRRPAWRWLKELQSDDQVFLRVIANALDQLLRLIHGLVGVIVERAILQQLTQGALAFVHTLQDGIQPGNSVVQLGCKLRVFGNLPNAPLPALTSATS